MIRPSPIVVLTLVTNCICTTALADTTNFFNPSQVATPVDSAITSDTIRSNGYLFTYTRDKLFTGGTGHVIGRQVRIPWPEGVEAQAVTTPPPGVTDYKARLTIQRADGSLFDLISFTAKLLANTAGAGANIEIMPLVNGEDAFNDPLYFNATGYYGSTFSYDESPNYLGSTALLKDFDTYKIGLYVDFAFTALTLDGAAVPSVPGDYNGNYVVDAADYTAWRDNLDAPPGTLPNDVDGGLIGLAQYHTWRTNFGAAAGRAAAFDAVAPEPAALLLAVAATLSPGRRRRPDTTPARTNLVTSGQLKTFLRALSSQPTSSMIERVTIVSAKSISRVANQR